MNLLFAATTRIAIFACSLISVLSVAAEELGVATPVLAPIHHKALWRSEKNLFGYQPRFYPNVVSFDENNNPYMFKDGGVQTLDNSGNWIKSVFTSSIKKRASHWNGEFLKGPFAEEHVVFDDAGDAYILINASRSNVATTYLLHSRDKCRSWTAYSVGYGPGRMEFRDGHNDIPGPPPIMMYGRNTGLLKLISPRKKDDGTIEIGAGRIIANDSLMSPSHSGGGNFTVTKNGLTHIAWASSSIIPGKELSGTPCFARSLNNKTGVLSQKVFMGFGGAGRPDPHNIPCLTIDGKGFLHLLIGAHHDQFLYAKSLKPNNVLSGWSRPVRIGTPKALGQGSYTYTGWVCDKNNTLHCVARWAGAGYFFRLVYLRKKTNENWDDHKYLTIPFRSGYSIWYHKLTLDRKGRLFCNYLYTGGGLNGDERASYFRKYPGQSESLRFLKQDPCVLVSDNGGDAWRIAITNDFSIKPEKKKMLGKKRDVPIINNYLPFNITYQSGGFIQPIAVCEGIVYLGAGNRLVVLDANDPRKIRQIVGFTGYKGKLILLREHNGFLYALIEKKGIIVFDISNPAHPKQLSTLSVNGVTGIDFNESIAYLTVGKSGVVLVDIANPSRLKQISQLKLSGAAISPRIHNKTLFVAMGSSGIRIIDVSDVSAPKEVNYIQSDTSEATAYALTINNNRLYVSPATNSAHVIYKVFDIEKPHAPKAVNSIARNGWGWGIQPVFKGDRIYSPVIYGLRVLENSNEYQDEGFWTIPARESANRARRIAIEGHRLYLTLGMGGLKVFDISTPSTIKVIGYYKEPATPWSLDADSGHVYVADYEGQIYIYNTDKPKHPELITVFDTGKAILSLVVNNNRAYVLHGKTGITIYDTSIPAKIVKIAVIPMSNIRDIAIQGTTLFCAQENRGVRIVDIANLDKPKEIVLYKTEKEVLGIDVSGDYLYLALEQKITGGVRILNISKLKNILNEGEYATETDVYDVTFKNNKIYASMGPEGVRVLNLSSPHNIKSTGAIKTPGSTFSCEIIDDSIYIAGGISGLRVINCLKTK